MPGKLDQLDADYVAVFSTEHGERVLRDLMSGCYFWQNTCEESTHKTAFNEGRRNVVLEILDHVRPNKMSLQEVAEEYNESLTDSRR